MSVLNGNAQAGYRVPEATRAILEDGILNNPLIAKALPQDAKQLAQKVHFDGSAAPLIPINWRFAESIAALKGLEAVMIMALLKKKYNVDVQSVSINTDHASLFFMSTLLWTLDPNGLNITSEAIAEGNVEMRAKLLEFFPNYDFHRGWATPHRASTTNIYKTKDDRFFHLHGSMNPDASLESIGLPKELDTATFEEAWEPFVEQMSKLDSETMQSLATDKYKQAGTICWTTEEYRNSKHGQANSHVGLFEIRSHDTGQKPCWWPDTPEASAVRPLVGLKVVDITRVIAAPSVTRGLAELGASVMRVTAPHLADYSSLHCDMNWGKWNCHLDFREEKDRALLRSLILDADVVVTAYRPYVLDKWGLAEADIISMCKDRDRGIIYARENCYGWHGPWSDRSGWQQISDACCGVSMSYGQAMGNDEPVTPIFPNSDYCTGIAGVAGILQALSLRADNGGSYTVDLALNYYSQWLVNSVGTYPTPVWETLWTSHGKPVFRHYHPMLYSIPRMLALLRQKPESPVCQDSFFENRDAANLGVKIRTVKPVLVFPNGEVELGFQVGTRGNGVDRPMWPNDLLAQSVH